MSFFQSYNHLTKIFAYDTMHANNGISIWDFVHKQIYLGPETFKWKESFILEWLNVHENSIFPAFLWRRNKTKNPCHFRFLVVRLSSTYELKHNSIGVEWFGTFFRWYNLGRLFLSVTNIKFSTLGIKIYKI
jgi:hypothetical protein